MWEGKEVYRRTMHMVPETVETAIRLFQAGRVGEAEGVCRQIVAVDSANATAWHLLGLIAANAQRAEVAVDYLSRAIALDPTNAEGHNNLGAVFMQEGRWAEAEACFRRATDRQPAFAAAQSNLAKALYDQQKLEEA